MNASTEKGRLVFPNPIKLVDVNHPVLHAFASPLDIETTDLQALNDRLVINMFKLMHQKHGIGLAAPQVGVNLRVFIMSYAGICETFLNPRIIKAPGKLVNSFNEGCLSYPGLLKSVKRHKRVIVEYTDIKGIVKKLDARGTAAFCVQHEIDHLNGITIGD